MRITGIRIFDPNPKGRCALENMMTIMKNIKANLLAALKSLSKVLYENIKLIMIGMILILMIIAGAILVSLYFGGDVVRQLTITEIKGIAYITRGTKKLSAGKGTKLMSGDIISTNEKSTVRISLDDDKYIFIEPDSSVYIYFTDIASEGDISVNLSRGAAICELNEKLKKKATFNLKTPNSIVSVRGTVFRAQFDYMESYSDSRGVELANVMITQVQNFDGSVNLQLYDSSRDPFDLPKLLVERTSAQMITADDVCQYGYLNYDIDLGSINEDALHEILRASNEKELAFSHNEINAAYKHVVEENRQTGTVTEISTEASSEEIFITTTVTTTTEATTEESATTTTPPESTEESSGGTLRSTAKTYEYTTYSGIKWWELTGNTNTDLDDYDDWFTEETSIPFEAVTTVPDIPEE